MSERHILIISPMYERWDYLERCIRSVKAQNYENYTHVVVNDGSDRPTDFPYMSGMDNFVLHDMMEHTGSAVRSQVLCLTAYTYGNKDSIVMLLDGDDYLVNNPEIFNFYNDFYQRNDTDFTYGSMWSIADQIPLIAQPYPPDVIKKKHFRKYKFNWNMPYTHLRTFRKELWLGIDQNLLKDKEGNYYKEGGDNAIFYALIEQARGDKIFAISDIVVNYNDVNPMNDYKIHPDTQNRNADEILSFGVNVPTEKVEEVKVEEVKPDVTVERLHAMSEALHLMPPAMKEYLVTMRDDMGICPKVVYDIGSCVLHWQQIANDVWNKNDVKYIGFDAMSEAGAIHEKFGIEFHPVLLGDQDGKIVDFYQNLHDPGGNSIYAQNSTIAGDEIKFESVQKTTNSLDSYMRAHSLPMPDLIKLDVQGSELNILKGAPDILLYARDIIIEGQNMDYNIGAPMFAEVKEWLEGQGWKMVTKIFDSGADADYHFHNNRYKFSDNIAPKEDYPVKTFLPATKRIMIAIPTNKHIEVETFKGIYDLDLPSYIKTDFRYSFGYQIDQIRNLIASWVVNERFDYLFFVDSDIVLPSHALNKLLYHDVDIVSGMYIERIPEQPIIELINLDGSRFLPTQVKGSLQEIAACGMGCCLIRREVLVDVGYPQFVYKSALDHKDTQPEDFYFCNQARQKGYRVWADTSINCSHIGKNVFRLIS